MIRSSRKPRSLGVGTRAAATTRKIHSSSVQIRRPVRVMLFQDRRHSDNPLARGRPQQLSEVDPRQRTGKLPVDRLLITGLFKNVLERIGCDTNPQSSAAALRRDIRFLPVVLEGQIWSLSFQTRPTPLFDIDLSLTLSDTQASTILWQTDLPTEGNLPLWIGVGCTAEDMLSMALAELESLALVHFSSAHFLEAVGVAGPQAAELSNDPGGSHKVVASSSWTGTDEGKITATAHESGGAAPVAKGVSGKAFRKSAARERGAKRQHPATVPEPA